ncbi:hypothetical protein [Rhodococcus jostii]|uniref:hypothetical protein n=1 Tax=Rhodococcus jostii TaxID=132919 RepID=UPI00363AF0BB
MTSAQFRAIPLDPENALARSLREGIIDASAHGAFDEKFARKFAGYVLCVIDELEAEVARLRKAVDSK